MMASSALQLIGYVLALVGVSAKIAATFMVEWTRVDSVQGPTRINQYIGLWERCSETGRKYSCETYQSLINLETELQVTRAVMLLSAVFSICGVLVATLGLKCTNCLHGNKQVKNNTTLAGGILSMIAGVLALSVTSWYASNIVQSSAKDNQARNEFGSALFVSWAGAILSLVGGVFLGCRCPTQTPSFKKPKLSFKQPKLQPESGAATDYV